MAKTTPVFAVPEFAGRCDNGSESAATWKYADGTCGDTAANATNRNWTQAMDENFRVRFTVQETAGGAENNKNFKFQYSYKGGTWTDITTSSSYIRAFTTTGFADGDDTTQQIGDGTFITDNDCCCEDGVITGTADFASNETEAELCCQIRSADVTGGDTLQIRIVATSGEAISGTPATPTITAEAGPSPISGTATINFAGTSTLKGDGELSGTAAVVFGGESNLRDANASGSFQSFHQRAWGACPPTGAQIDWSHPLAKDLVGLWTLNEGGGRLVIDHVYGNHGQFDSTMEGDEWIAGPNGGRALNFIPEASTTGEFVQIGYDGATTTPTELQFVGSAGEVDMSVFAWLAPSTTQQSNWGYAFACNDGSTSANYALVINTANQLNIRFGSSSYTSTITHTADQWDLFGFTCKPNGGYNDITVWNRDQVGYNQPLSSVGIAAGSGVCIGCNPNQTNRFYRGGVGPIYVWRRALSQNEIRQLYADPFCMFVKPRWHVGGTSAAAGAIAGTATIDFAGTSTLAGDGELAGTATIDFAGTSTLSAKGRMVGTATTDFAGTSTLAGTGSLAGTATTDFAGTSTLAGTGSIDGSASITWDFLEDTKLLGKGALIGTSAFVFDGSATPVFGGAIDGTAAITFDATGTLAGTGYTSGTAAVIFANSGTLAGTGSLAGTSAFVFDATSTLSASGELAGSSAFIFDGTSTIGGIGGVVGTAAFVFDGTATLLAAGELSGTADFVFGGSGTLAGGGANLTGTAAIDFAGTSVLAGKGSLSGTASTTLSGSATLSGTGYINGSATTDFGSSAQLIGIGGIVATATVTFGGTGVMEGTGQLDGSAELLFVAQGSITGLGIKRRRIRVTF